MSEERCATCRHWIAPTPDPDDPDPDPDLADLGLCGLRSSTAPPVGDGGEVGWRIVLEQTRAGFWCPAWVVRGGV